MNLLETSVACWVVVDEVPPVAGKLVLPHCWVQLVRCWLEQDWKRKEVLKGSVMITIKSFEIDQQNKNNPQIYYTHPAEINITSKLHSIETIMVRG